MPPVAPTSPVRTELHGDVRIDPYAWLRDRKDPRTRAYLEAENHYAAATMRQTADLQQRLFDEMLARIVEDHSSVPAVDGPFAYFVRGVKGEPYPVWARKPVAAGGSLGAEQIVFDGNALGARHEYFAVGALAVSEDHRRVAIAYDTDGDEHHRVRVVEIGTGAVVDEFAEDAGAQLAWANDGATLFYTRLDAANRSWQLWRHRLGTADDVLVYQEDDDMFDVGIGRTRSDAYLVMAIDSQITSEVHTLPADRPTGTFSVVEPRRTDVEYEIDHRGDRFFVRTNHRVRDFEIMTAPLDRPGRASWSPFVAPAFDASFDGMAVFAGHLVVSGRDEGLPQIWVHDLADGRAHAIDLHEPTYSIAIDENPVMTAAKVRISFESPVTPETIHEYDMDAHTLVQLQREPVPGYRPDGIVTEFLHAEAPDGTRVPISLVRRRDAPRPAPLLLQGYGAYGATYDAGFSRADLALVERGVTVAIAHVRGGGELGRNWYEQGKLLRKKNSFTDFIACAEFLVAEGWADRERIAIEGGSAGGLLVGAVTTMRPELFRAVVAEVPFVDVVNTMLDASLPLTAAEWEEWGDPRKPEFYRYMRSYSPYDNVRAQAYPEMLVLAGWNDPRVGYWEPAKWVARIRAQRTDDRLLLLRTDMGSGHGGPSGRYGSLRERAFVLAFLLDRLGVAR